MQRKSEAADGGLMAAWLASGGAMPPVATTHHRFAAGDDGLMAGHFSRPCGADDGLAASHPTVPPMCHREPEGLAANAPSSRNACYADDGLRATASTQFCPVFAPDRAPAA